VAQKKEDKMRADLFEEIAIAVREDGEECTAEDVERLLESLEVDRVSQEWLASASDKEIFDWAVGVLINTQPPLDWQREKEEDERQARLAEADMRAMQ
jgi:hypothetical protein